LGIGTTSPADLLTINANAANARIRFNNSNSPQWTAGNNALDNSFRLGSSIGFQFAIFQATGNVLLQNGGTFTDAGFKLDVNGSVRATGSISAAAGVGRGTLLNQTLVATANNDVLVGLDVAPTFTTGAFTGVQQEHLVIRGGNNPIIRFKNGAGSTTWGQFGANASELFFNAQGGALSFVAGNTQAFYVFSSTRNVTLQNGGTFTDIASARLAVNSTTQGFLPPRMTTTQKNAIASPATGLMVYDTTLNLISVYNGTIWISL
jgi:hypothetical protein